MTTTIKKMSKTEQLRRLWRVYELAYRVSQRVKEQNGQANGKEKEGKVQS